MKKTVIGIALLAAGIFDMLGLILAASVYLPHITSWENSYPSRLWFLIFAGRSPYNDGANGLGLGLLFVLGALLAAFGLIILIIEFVRKEK
jgi:hypothetical protein